MIIALTVMALAAIALSAWRLHEQDRTIRDLNNRLMARNYTEYVVHERRPERPPDDDKDERMSWYDDGTGDDK